MVIAYLRDRLIDRVMCLCKAACRDNKLRHGTSDLDGVG